MTKCKTVKEKRNILDEVVNILRRIGNIEIRVELTQMLIPIGVLYTKEMFEEELTQLVGERYKRNSVRYRPDLSGGGSIFLGREKVPVYVPRVRDKKGRAEIKLRTYECLKRSHKVDESAFKNILHWISCR